MNNIRTSYKDYKKEQKKVKVNVIQYIDICCMYLNFLMEKVLQGERIVLPLKLGEVFVIGRKKSPVFLDNGRIKNLAPDWVATKKLRDSNPIAKKENKIVYHTNEHTDGFTYKIFWTKKGMFVKNKDFYSVKFMRHHKRKLSKLLKEGKEYLTKN